MQHVKKQKNKTRQNKIFVMVLKVKKIEEQEN